MDEIDQSAPEVEQEAPGESQEQETLETEVELDEQGNPKEAPPEEEDEEIELNGKKARVPKEFKDAFLKNADYTQKTQALAEQRRMVEEQAQEIAQTQQRQQAFRQAYARLDGIDQQLQQYNGVNWNQLDPQVAQQHWMTFQQLKEARQNLTGQISQAEHQQAVQAQQSTAQRLHQAEQELAREIKDWSPETKSKLREYGKSIGISEQQLNNVDSPVAIKLLHKARLYDEMMAKATKKPVAVPVAPLKTVKSGSGASTDPNRLSADEWAKRRNAELAKRNR